MDGVLVTGGAGYIGSHVVRQLVEADERVVVLDDLSSGFPEAVLGGQLVVGNCGDADRVGQILRDHRIGTVMHFAAHTVVPESVSDPLKYYRNNTSNSRALLEACVGAGVKHFVFSSTAAVYGMPESGVATEETPTAAINPYGTSKLMTEWMLRDVSAATGIRFAALRYFNVAGADPLGRIGQSTAEATHLIKVACQTALGMREHLDVYGTDYPTGDGTGVRDYIHVEDLAAAHLMALAYLREGGASTTLNCGYGHGFSVLEVIRSVERAAKRPLPVRKEPRRPGDPPALIADASKIRRLLGWEPAYDDLDVIVKTALAWEENLLEARKTSVRA